MAYGFPTIIRPSFTLGGTGGGIAYNMEEFETICKRGLEASPTNELLIEESLLGWKEYEMEVVRDKADNCIIICSIENLDPMGVHTGDSITVAPAQTLTDKEYRPQCRAPTDGDPEFRLRRARHQVPCVRTCGWLPWRLTGQAPAMAPSRMHNSPAPGTYGTSKYLA